MAGSPSTNTAGKTGSGMLAGLLAAALFGASAPVAKLLLPGVGPLLLASLLYLGAALGLSGWLALRGAASSEARLRRADAWPMVGIALLGGVGGPVLMLVGLGRMSGVAGSLLLNLEAPSTMLVAVLLFHEHLGRREVAAALVIVAGGAALGYRPGELHADGWGIAAITGACLCWAGDNNLTQRLSLRDPAKVVRLKTLSAGLLTGTLALLTGAGLPPLTTVGLALGVGALSYGVSILLDMIALRHLGAAREAAIFATAPFAGALLAIPLLGEHPGRADAAGAAAMLLGVVLLLRARHSHRHTHAEVVHDHSHNHDEHHQHDHAHAGSGPVTEPHSHPHRHAPLTHEHPHVSDAHHRHSHR
ncbi:MAG: EamA family transporter [Deltaproteobacteria bacterium]|nr:EamA family transporter [Deltaproteobacteria bacterium]